AKESLLACWSGSGRRGAWFSVGSSISGDQKALDLIVRAGRRRVQLSVSGGFLSGDRHLEIPEVGAAIRMDWDESDHDLSHLGVLPFHAVRYSVGWWSDCGTVRQL